MTKYLRHKENGEIYDWNEQLSKHPKLEEVGEETAYPERFPNFSLRHVAPSVRLNKPIPLSSEIPELVPQNPELDRDASRRLKVAV